MIGHSNIQREYLQMMREIEHLYEDRGSIPESVMCYYRLCNLIYYRDFEHYLTSYGQLSVDAHLAEEAKLDVFGKKLSDFELDTVRMLNDRVDQIVMARRRLITIAEVPTSSAIAITPNPYSGENYARYRVD